MAVGCLGEIIFDRGGSEVLASLSYFMITSYDSTVVMIFHLSSLLPTKIKKKDKNAKQRWEKDREKNNNSKTVVNRESITGCAEKQSKRKTNEARASRLRFGKTERGEFFRPGARKEGKKRRRKRKKKMKE